MISPSTPRQTLSYLRNLFESRGIEPKNKLGQCFLIDLNLLDILVQTAELTSKDLVLEVGCGTGSLTARLTDLTEAVLGVEIDSAFVDLMRETLVGRENVRIIHSDVLKNKNEINPGVLTALEEAKRESGCDNVKLVANLPYAVAVPVIGNFLLSDLAFERMVVTVQWEIAERLIAEPGSKAYGSLAVLVQSLAEVTLVRKLSPSVFWPRPQVASAFVLIRPDDEKRAKVGDVKRFRRFLRDLYVHRRKNIRGALHGLPNGRREKSEVDRMLAEIGIDGTLRAEMLDIEQHLRLCEKFGQFSNQ
jgi:16S rRNA (adenine1518-N6/adenine1519-N6)-dimethyltransferase